jgi:glycosyltransferase involved in cell wall biosynthesis
MVSIYDEIDADLFMVPGNSQYSGEAAFFCRKRGKKFVFLSGSDIDYLPDYKLYPSRNDMYAVPHVVKTYAIENAALHIVQNERQAVLLREGYGRSCFIVKNPIDPTPQFSRNPDPRTILWVGKSDERTKRPSLLFDLIGRMPEYQFVVIMPLADPAVHEECLKRARNLPNVTLLERVPFDVIESYFANARLHLNTSVFEGFPNTFLQAAKYGVPTLALKVDPGNMLSEHGCGLICGDDLSRLESDVHSMMTDSPKYRQVEQRSLRYVREYHDKEVIIPKYEQALNSILEATPSHTTISGSGANVT